jgi:signal transduction histidine kinase
MAFIKTVVMRHGGEVRVESEPGRGTTVTIWLPAADEPAAE